MLTIISFSFPLNKITALSVLPSMFSKGAAEKKETSPNFVKNTVWLEAARAQNVKDNRREYFLMRN
jgi:hypothetical protein